MRSLVKSTVAVLAAVAVPAVALSAQAIINNGTVMLGVDRFGQLNIPGPASAQGVGYVGLRHSPTNYESTAPGCLCEGWGVGVRGGPGAGLSGWANNASGSGGLVSISFTSTPTTATSVVALGALRVTHAYKPSPTPNLYLVEVTIQNMSASTLGGAGNPNGVVYRRVMDWDIEPTAFSENVTLRGGTARYNAITNPTGNLIGSGDDGFESSNVMTGSGANLVHGCAGPTLNVDFTDAGPCDHGAVFDFGFGSLAAGASITFKTYYGAATSETAMLAALGLVGAEAYSLGQCSTTTCETIGTPVTFAFGFTGVGGTSIEPSPVPEPATVGLFATGLIGLGAVMRRRSKK
jgi:hypothetical protein